MEALSSLEPNLPVHPQRTILVCYHPRDRRRTITAGGQEYEHCDYCLTLREGTTGHWKPRTRLHTATALLDREGRTLSSRWKP